MKKLKNKCCDFKNIMDYYIAVKIKFILFSKIQNITLFFKKSKHTTKQ